MQNTTSNFTLAITGGEVTRTPLEMYADWAMDGYGAAGSIDDLSGWAQKVSVAHGFDDGFPSPIHHETPEPGLTATLSAQVDQSMRASRYFSPFAGSAVSAFDRDRAPIRVRTGVITVAGAEQVTVFTGQMSDLPIATDQATLAAISASRFKLTKVITLPAVSRSYEGLNASWPVSFALAQCGIYVSPPPRAGCRYWAPMHGSAHPFIPATNTLGFPPAYLADGDYPFFRMTTELFPSLDGRLLVSVVPVEFIAGPFLQAAFAHVDPTQLQSVTSKAGGMPLPLADGDAFLSQSQNRVRIEFWARGDSYDTSGLPPLLVVSPLHPVRIRYQLAGGQVAEIGIDITTFKVYCRVFDGTHDVTVLSATAVPQDGQWHACGGAWDVAAGKQWTYLDGVVASNSTAIVTAGLPVAEDVNAFDCGLHVFAGVPIAEIQVTTGDSASPTLTPTWIGDSGYFTPGAVVRPSQLELEALTEPPTEAFALIEMYAAAEYAWLRFDESDRLLYYPLGWWARAEQQLLVDMLDTSTNVGTVTLNSDPKRVVNACVVSYTQTTVPDPNGSLKQYVLNSSDIYLIPVGTSTLTLGLDQPIVGLTTTIVNGDAAAVAAGGVAFESFVTLNIALDGAEAYATSAQVAVTVAQWTSTQVTLQFVNNTSSVWYTTNSSAAGGASCPTIGLRGVPVATRQASVVAEEITSIGVRGVRGASVSLPAIQREDMAVRAARRIALENTAPRLEVGELQVFADPRRQPGDLVTLVDRADTGYSGRLRVLSVQHEIDGAAHTQKVKLVSAPPIGYWGTAIWGQSMWGDPET